MHTRCYTVSVLPPNSPTVLVQVLILQVTKARPYLRKLIAYRTADSQKHTIQLQILIIPFPPSFSPCSLPLQLSPLIFARPLCRLGSMSARISYLLSSLPCPAPENPKFNSNGFICPRELLSFLECRFKLSTNLVDSLLPGGDVGEVIVRGRGVVKSS